MRRRIARPDRVRDGASARYALMLKSRLVGENPTEVERLFRRLKGFRRIFSRFEKLDLMFTAFIHFALIIDMICVNTP